MTRSTKGIVVKTIVIILVASIIGGGMGYFYHESNLMEQYYDKKINELQGQINAATQEVYCAKVDLKAGIVIDENCLSRKVIMSDQNGYLTKDDFGKSLMVDVLEGTVLTENMLSENAVDIGLREVEYGWIDVPSNIEMYDYVDVRLLYPDGTDYVIASKKQIKYLNETKLICDLWNSEEEILLLDAACVDAYLFDGCKIYMTRYIYPSVQEASVVNYTPSEQTIELILDNPNIVKVASEYLSLESRRRNVARLKSILEDREKLSNDNNGWYTEADEYAEDILNSQRPISGSELPKEFGGSLWE